MVWASRGSSIQIVVPRTGGLSSENRPPSASTRSTSPVSPELRPRTAPPHPSVVTVARTPDSPELTVTETSEARECLTAFASTSDTT